MNDIRRVMFVFGTRPEAIKMAPVYRALASSRLWDVRVCVTAQHRQMLDQVLGLFSIVPDFDLDLMRPGQNLTDVSSDILRGMRDVFGQWRPEVVLVHGDTTTAMASSLAAFYARIKVAHVEAGLRTNDISAPWPEEMNRRVISRLASFHFAPTPAARSNLLSEGCLADSIVVTGNTVIDALLEIVQLLETDPALGLSLRERFAFLNRDRHLILVTVHRRESFGAGLERVCKAIGAIAKRQDVDVVFPVHPNPQVRGPVHSMLGGLGNVYLIDPLDYLPFVYLMKRCYLILTDSGGVQEEAPSLGKPVLVLRDITERPEGLAAGTVKLVGTDEVLIASEVQSLLEDPGAYERMASASNPYGDGQAAGRIADAMVRFCSAFPAFDLVQSAT